MFYFQSTRQPAATILFMRVQLIHMSEAVGKKIFMRQLTALNENN